MSGGSSGSASGASGSAAGATTPGQSVIPTSGGHAHRASGAPEVRCTYESVGASDPLGSTGGSIDPGTQAAGTRVWKSCFDTATGRRVSGPQLVTLAAATPRPPTSGSSPAPDPAASVIPGLVESALAGIDLDLPSTRFSPPGATLPNVDTQLGIAVTEPHASAGAAGVTVTVAATVESVTLALDDGPTLTCPRRSAGVYLCTHRFAAPTRDLTIGVTATWHLRWTATDGSGGDLGTVSRTAAVPYRVQAMTTVIRRPGG